MITHVSVFNTGYPIVFSDDSSYLRVATTAFKWKHSRKHTQMKTWKQLFAVMQQYMKLNKQYNTQGQSNSEFRLGKTETRHLKISIKRLKLEAIFNVYSERSLYDSPAICIQFNSHWTPHNDYWSQWSLQVTSILTVLSLSVALGLESAYVVIFHSFFYHMNFIFVLIFESFLYGVENKNQKTQLHSAAERVVPKMLYR